MALPFFNAYRGSIGRFFQGDLTLVGYWQLDGSSIDNSGNGNNGTDTAVSYSPAYSRFNGGQGASFNGSNSYISTSFPGISNTNTVILWVNPGISQQLNGTRILKIGSGANFEIACLNTTDPHGFYIGYYNGSSTTLSAQTSNIYPSNNWYCVIYYFNNTTCGIYVNGVLAVTGTGTSSSIGATTLYIGSNLGTAWFYNGLIDEMAVFNRVLSPAEISQYYQWATSAQKKSWYSLLPAILLSLSEAVTNTDTFLKGIYRSFTESITNSDTFSGIKVLLALFIEAVQNTDALIKAIGKNLLEAVQNADTLIKTTIKNFRESIANSDTLNTLKSVILNLFESVKSTASLWINGMFIDVWWTKRIKPIINWIKRNKPQ